jgi:hypothetical protein
MSNGQFGYFSEAMLCIEYAKAPGVALISFGPDLVTDIPSASRPVGDANSK